MKDPEAKEINLWKIATPVVIGLSVSLYLIFQNFSLAALQSIHFSEKLVGGLLFAVLTIVIRDGAFMYKVRLSTGSKITWKKTFQTITMWEFMACIAPKVAETPFVVFVLKNSGLTYGKSVAVLMLNVFFDNLAFVVVFAVLYLIRGENMLLFSAHCPDLEGHAIMLGIRDVAEKAWIGYLVILLFCAFIGIALFLLPYTTKKFFTYLASFSFFARFKSKLLVFGDDIEMTAQEFKNQSTSFWVKMTVASFINWTCRYLLANAVLYAFSNIDLNMLEIFSRQYVLWVFTSIPSTPGSSGVAELSFNALNCEFMPEGLSGAITLVWRIYSYYFYIILGMLLLPKWVKQIAKS